MTLGALTTSLALFKSVSLKVNCCGLPPAEATFRRDEGCGLAHWTGLTGKWWCIPLPVISPDMLSAHSPISLNNVVCNGALSYLLLHSFHVCMEWELRMRTIARLWCRDGDQGKSELSAHLGVCGCDKCVWVQRHTITTLTSSSSAMWSHNAAIQRLVSFKMSDTEKGPVCLGWYSLVFLCILLKTKYFFVTGCPRSDLTLVVPTYFLSQVAHIC